MAMRVAVVNVPGQSWQQGVTGTAYGRSLTGSYGYPTRDNGGATVRSMLPMISELCGRAGISTLLLNRAIGGTGMCQYWTGRVQGWANGIGVQTGGYFINGGVLWKCTQANASNPYATSTTTPAAGTGADGVTWSSLGAPGAGDVAGNCYDRTSPRFDPNGAIAAAIAAVQATANVDRRFALIEIGQGDNGTPADQLTVAHRACIQHYLANGIEVMYGQTGISRTTGMGEWMRDTLYPVWLTLCAEFAGTRGFHVGANLYRDLASNPADPFNTGPVYAVEPASGLQSDNLHPNSILYDRASALWATALQRCVTEPGF